jgi:hypothetical protein
LPFGKLNEIRREQLLDLAYQSPFRIGLCVFITLPSAPGGPWGGVAGVQKLIGVRALRKLEQEESARVFKLAEEFIRSKGAVIAFQKNTWNCLRSENDLEYSIGAAREARLKGTLKRHGNLTLLCVPPTRLAGPCRKALSQILKNNI